VFEYAVTPQCRRENLPWNNMASRKRKREKPESNTA
jgi:hypothetical protein